MLPVTRLGLSQRDGGWPEAFIFVRLRCSVSSWWIFFVPFVVFANHNGIFPCFFGGFLSRFVSSVDSAVMSFARV
jgi:hypothetical protein